LRISSVVVAVAEDENGCRARHRVSTRNARVVHSIKPNNSRSNHNNRDAFRARDIDALTRNGAS